MEKIFHGDVKQERRSAILIYIYKDIRSKTVKRDKEGHYIIVKESMHQRI